MLIEAAGRVTHALLVPPPVPAVPGLSKHLPARQNKGMNGKRAPSWHAECKLGHIYVQEVLVAGGQRRNGCQCWGVVHGRVERVECPATKLAGVV